MKNYLVVDVGTSSIRAIRYTAAGRLVDQFRQTYQPKYEKNGAVTQDSACFADGCQSVIAQAVMAAQNGHDEIVALAITAQRSSLIPVKNGQALAPAIMWQDTRVNPLLERYRDYNPVFLQRSGSKLNAVYLGPKLFLLKHLAPEIYQAADYYLNISSFLTLQMTGTYTMDTTYGSRTNLMNIRTLSWDAALFSILDLNPDKMPTLIQPGATCGYITSAYSRLTGLPVGLPVISAGGDQQCAALGSGLVNNVEVSINTGTGGYLIKNIDELPGQLDSRMIYNQSAQPGKYILEIDLLACSSILNWFLDNFYQGITERFQLLDQDLQTCYGQVIQLSVLPYHKGRSVGVNDTKIRSAFSNIGLSTRRQDLLYALMASLFIEINQGLGIFKSLGPIGSVTISGGLTKSAVLNQLQADAYNLMVNQSSSTETTAFGALISALVNTGVYPSFVEAAKELISDSRQKFLPNAENVDQLLAFNDRNQILYRTLAGTAASYYKGA